MSKKILNNYRYWNVGGDIIYRTFLYGTYEKYGDNTCKIDLSDNEVSINFEYWDNGSAGSYGLHWRKQKGE